MPSSPNWQNSGEKLTGLESQNDLMNICSRSEVRLVQPERDEQWNLESVKAVLVSPWELRVRTELDAPPTRQKFITNQMLDQHGRTPLCTRCSLGAGSHSSECRALKRGLRETWILSRYSGNQLRLLMVSNTCCLGSCTVFAVHFHHE